MLLPPQPALCPGPARALLDLSSQRGAAQAAPAAALRLPPGAPLAGGLGISLGSGAGGAPRVAALARCAARPGAETRQTQAPDDRSARRAIQLAPGVSVRPCSRIEQKTTSAVRSKMR